jgi:hypothetical protein
VILQGDLLELARRSRYLIVQKVKRFRSAAGTQVVERERLRKKRRLKLKKPNVLKLVRMPKRPLLKKLRRALMWK